MTLRLTAGLLMIIIRVTECAECQVPLAGRDCQGFNFGGPRPDWHHVESPGLSCVSLSETHWLLMIIITVLSGSSESA